MKKASLALGKQSVLFAESGTQELNYVNISCIDSQDNWFEQLRAECENYGLFAQRKLVVVQELTELLIEREEDFYPFLESVKDNEETVVIILLSDSFELGSVKKPSAHFKKLTNCLNPVFFEKQTPAKLNAWLIKRFTREGLICDNECSSEILSLCSCDMFALRGESEKLICYMKATGVQKLNSEIVRNIVSPLKSNGNFDFSNAITNGDYLRALELFKTMEKCKERPEIIFSEISNSITNMYSVRVLSDAGHTKGEISKELSLHEYRVGLYLATSSKIGVKRLSLLVEKCHEADLKIKSTPLNSYTVLQNLIFEVCR